MAATEQVPSTEERLETLYEKWDYFKGLFDEAVAAHEGNAEGESARQSHPDRTRNSTARWHGAGERRAGGALAAGSQWVGMAPLAPLWSPAVQGDVDSRFRGSDWASVALLQLPEQSEERGTRHGTCDIRRVRPHRLRDCRQ